MKKFLSFIFLGCALLPALAQQGVTIGSNNPPDPSAVLDLQSTTKGFLPPRLTTTQRNAIVNPASGLMVYNTTTSCLNMYMPITGWRNLVCDCQNPPVSTFSNSPGSISVNQNITFNPTTTGQTYAWTFQGGNPATSTAQNPVVSWPNSGNYTVTLTVTAQGGCSSTTTVTVTVNNCPPPGGNSITFSYTGSAQTWTVPNCVTSIVVNAYGAEGGTSNGVAASGGKGGFASATIPVNPGEVLNVYVGQMGPSGSSLLTGGWNGGGGTNLACPGDLIGGGGGASDVRRTPYSLNERLIVAGGGGGAGYQPSQYGTYGGPGGGMTGGNGISANWCSPSCEGKGGTQNAGGAGGQRSGEPNALNGTLGDGGRGQGSCSGGGGGGGGYYGGGGGNATAGGGGSSYVDYPGNTNKTTTAGLRSGNGEVTIVY